MHSFFLYWLEWNWKLYAMFVVVPDTSEVLSYYSKSIDLLFWYEYNNMFAYVRPLLNRLVSFIQPYSWW